MGAARAREAYPGRVRSFRWEVPDGETWRTVHEGGVLAEDDLVAFGPVKTKRLRFHVTEATEGPTFWEIVLFPPKKP